MTDTHRTAADRLEASTPIPDAQTTTLVAAAREHLEAHATGSGARAIRRRLAARRALEEALAPFAQEEVA